MLTYIFLDLRYRMFPKSAVEDSEGEKRKGLKLDRGAVKVKVLSALGVPFLSSRSSHLEFSVRYPLTSWLDVVWLRSTKYAAVKDTFSVSESMSRRVVLDAVPASSKQCRLENTATAW